jgi:hypothetical protein
MKHLKYLKYVLRHKYFVLIECLKYGLIWQGIIHDWTKFCPSEWQPYVEYFYGDKNKKDFDIAWNHHQKRHPHHWQYWLLREDNPRADFTMWWFGLQTKKEAVLYHFFNILPMPDRYRKEMIADWRGTVIAQGKTRESTGKWYLKNKENIFLHPDTEKWVEEELEIRRSRCSGKK